MSQRTAYRRPRSRSLSATNAVSSSASQEDDLDRERTIEFRWMHGDDEIARIGGQMTPHRARVVVEEEELAIIVVVQFNGLPLRAPGLHSLEVTLDGAVLATKQLPVVLADSLADTADQHD